MKYTTLENNHLSQYVALNSILAGITLDLAILQQNKAISTRIVCCFSGEPDGSI